MTFPTKTTITRRLTSAAIALFGGACAASAQTVHWGNALLDTLLKSDGTAITGTDGFHFELGLFGGGFIPTAGNTTDWITNWRPLDTAALNATAHYFTSSFEILTDPAGALDGEGRPLGVSNSPEASPGLKVEQGTSLFLLVYNNLDMNTTTELFLGGAGTWELPAVNSSQLVMPENFRLRQMNSSPVFGGANDARGGGNYFNEPASFALQTATFVPEPAALSLTLAAAALLAGRRRRNGI